MDVCHTAIIFSALLKTIHLQIGKKKYRCWTKLNHSVSFLSKGCPGSLCDCQFPSARGWECFFHRLDDHTLDTAEQLGPLRQPRPPVCQGPRWGNKVKHTYVLALAGKKYAFTSCLFDLIYCLREEGIADYTFSCVCSCIDNFLELPGLIVCLECWGPKPSLLTDI